MAQATINVTTIRSMYLNSGTPTGVNSNQVGEDNTFSETFRPLLQFDLSSIPAGSIITGVTYRATLEQAGSFRSSNNRTVRFYRMIQPWTSSATWSTYDGSNSWGTAGAGNTTTDRESQELGSGVCYTSWGDETTHDFTLDADLVQEWVNGDFTNNGFMMKMDTENADRYFWHTSTSGKEAKLIIDYDPPTRKPVIMLMI